MVNNRLVIIAESLRPPMDEGMKNTAVRLAQAFKDSRVKLSVFSHYNGELEGLNISPLPRNKLLFGFSFIKRLRDITPEAIIYIPRSSGTFASFIRAVLLKLFSGGRKIVLFNLQPCTYSPLIKYAGLSKLIDYVFAQSKLSLAGLEALDCQTVWVPGGVDPQTFHPVSLQEKEQLRQKYGIPTNARVLLHVGHMNSLRNVGALKVLSQMGYWVILVTSTSTVQDKMLLEELTAAGVKVYTEYIEHIKHFYQMTDCYIFPVVNACSAVDAPLSVLEAMGCNIPVVTTRFGALPEMFSQEGGMYFLDQVEDLALVVQKALADPCVQTRELVLPYTWEALAGKFLDIIFASDCASREVIRQNA